MVFRFSRHFGLTDTNDLSGEPYYAIIEDEQILAEPPVVDEKIKKQKDDMIIGINLPGKIKIKLNNGDRTIATYNTYAAQFGNVESLFGKKLTSQIVLDPATGSVISLKTEPLE